MSCGLQNILYSRSVPLPTALTTGLCPTPGAERDFWRVPVGPGLGHKQALVSESSVNMCIFQMHRAWK